MITWINILLKNFKAQTIHAGNLSEPFNVDVDKAIPSPVHCFFYPLKFYVSN